LTDLLKGKLTNILPNSQPNLPKLTKEEIDNMNNRSLSIEDFDSTINNLLKQRGPSPDGSLVNSIK
jgi:hypothetical protein